MEVIKEPTVMQRKAAQWRMGGHTIGFVPTMGYLHQGHLELMRRGRIECDRLVVSIFVNPKQFGQGEDFDKYPRDFERDSGLVREIGTDVVFYPSADHLYPAGFQTYVEVVEVTKNLCGASRPGHFRGVATVVTKLFNIVKPHRAYFGEKDYQQLIAIKRMAADLNMEVEVVGCPTVREEDGLAMSSRNVYLSPKGRDAALCLYRALKQAQNVASGGQKDAKVILREAANVIEKEPLARIDYIRLCHPQTLQELDRLEDEGRLLMAVYVENTRLIDNGPIYSSSYSSKPERLAVSSSR
jgi:pantoate--beta-alanine ligase